MENKLSAEQQEMIEREADIDVDKAPIELMNNEAYQWKNGYYEGYTAAAIKYLQRIKGLEDGLRGMVEVFEKDFPTVAKHGQQKHHVKAKQLLTNKPQ